MTSNIPESTETIPDFPGTRPRKSGKYGRTHPYKGASVLRNLGNGKTTWR